MDIINVVSVTSQATVKQWFEENDDGVQVSLYWRQAFDVRAYELSVCATGRREEAEKLETQVVETSHANLAKLSAIAMLALNSMV